MRHMRSDRRKGRGNRPAILAALWALIAVTLLCALAPIGPPLSRAKGSAFNPATTDVVLKSRAAARLSVPAPRLPDSDGVPPAAILCFAAILLTLSGAVRLSGAPLFPSIQVMRCYRRTRARRARAPPPSLG